METKCRSSDIERVKKRMNMVKFREGEDYWRFTGFYGEPDSSKRSVSWDLLRRLSRLSNLPWLCVGDYNAILSDSEKEGTVPTPQWQLRSFREALMNSGLCDVQFSGFPFTWANNREHPFTVRKRLDRTCVNFSWTARWSATAAQHLDRIYSDHAPIIVFREKQQAIRAEVGGCPTRFEALWIKSKDSEEVISKLWNNSLDDFNITTDLATRLEKCKIGLFRWNKSEFGNINKRIKSLENDIATIQSGAITNTSREHLSSLKTELESLLSAEEIKWK
ncbi:UNVERIFIED_CONTAM: hypothetical protein Sradi_1887700 [Sesamum radiatum]|uniref:Endonuclease/exonuclease/phosphatase domain-containing protein n=1 Tax=Sesamum radiatum TaxID=300843 RepID=A0AAW2TZ55_SESRA